MDKRQAMEPVGADRYMCDVKSGGSGYDFRRHVRREWS